MTQLQRTALLGVLAALAMGAAVTAQLPGQIYGVITDQEGNPLPDVLIVFTDPERPDFRLEERSDKRGRYRIRLTNAIVPYSVSLSKEGFVSINLTGVRVPARQETRRNIEMFSQKAAIAQGAVPEVDAEAAAKGSAVKIYNEGVVALNGGDLEIAKTLFTTALDRKADLASAVAAMARVHLELEEYGEAVTWALKAVEMETEVDSMNQVLYASYTALGDKKQAKEALAKLQEADPEKASLNMFNEAADLFNAGQLQEAQAAFESILEARPDHPRSHYMLGLCYVNSGDNAKAKSHFAKFLELAPDDPDASTAAEMVQYLE